MTNDKYKEFTKWVSKKAESLETMNLASVGIDLLIEFEEEQAKKEKEKEIKKAICDGMKEVSTKIDSYDNWIEISGWVEAIYQKLKERDLIK